MTKKTYKIHGMHCASCAMTIGRVLTKLSGVKAAGVNFASESVLIEFDERVVSDLKLAEEVDSVGYKLAIGSQTKIETEAIDENTKTISTKVLGMDSPHCAMIVGSALKKLSGIKNTDIDFSNQRAKVVFDSKKLAAGEIFKVITDAGYKPIMEQGEAEEILDK